MKLRFFVRSILVSFIAVTVFSSVSLAQSSNRRTSGSRIAQRGAQKGRTSVGASYGGRSGLSSYEEAYKQVKLDRERQMREYQEEVSNQQTTDSWEQQRRDREMLEMGIDPKTGKKLKGFKQTKKGKDLDEDGKGGKHKKKKKVEEDEEDLDEPEPRKDVEVKEGKAENADTSESKEKKNSKRDEVDFDIPVEPTDGLDRF